MTRPAVARIDLRALQHNFSQVQHAAPDSRVLAIIKANAYGHGMVRIAQALPDATGFGVACIDEAISLREAGFDRRIVLLEGLFGPDDLNLICGYRLDVVVHHDSQLDWLEQEPLLTPLDVWLKLDTGMHRLGFSPHRVNEISARLDAISQVNAVRYMTHFSCADDLENTDTHEQIELFNRIVAGAGGERSLANSAGVLGWPAARADWVRPGIMLYGSSPLAGRSAESLGLKPVMTLGTRLIAVNRRKAGDAIGYGADYRCPEDMPVGVAALGYGDGYPRHAPSGAPVLVNGQRAAIAGRVSMDMICVDLRACPDAQVGDDVTLWGDGLPIDEVATAAGTIAYELLCGVGARVQFDYIA
jgi:alanine racemase